MTRNLFIVINIKLRETDTVDELIYDGDPNPSATTLVLALKSTIGKLLMGKIATLLNEANKQRGAACVLAAGGQRHWLWGIALEKRSCHIK